MRNRKAPASPPLVDDRALALFEPIEIGFAFLDQELRVVHLNSVLIRQLGAPDADAVRGKRLPQDFPDVDVASTRLDDLQRRQRVEAAISGTSPWGRELGLRMVAAPIEHPLGAYFLIARDASEQQRAEQEALRNAARNEAILEASADGVATIDRNGRLLAVNSALERLFGYTREELVGQNVNVLMPEPYRSEHGGYLERYRRSGVPHIIGIGREVEGRRSDGTVFPVRLSVGEVQVENEVLFVGILSDLSARVAAEREVSRLGVFLEDSLNEIYIFDDETLRFRLVNRGARENLGYSLDELRERTPLDLKPRFNEAGFREMIAPLRRGAVPKLEFKTVHRRKDGSEYPVEVHLQYRAASNEFVAMILDTTERETLEDQLLQAQRMEAVGQLAGGIAHDFNNLLTSIQGSSELLAARLGAEDRSQRALERIQQAAARGAALTQQLLAFGRRQISQPEALDLNAAVAEVSELAGSLVGEDVAVEFDLAPSLPPIFADPSQVDQVVMNLIVNAGDAMPRGGTLSVSTRPATLDRAESERLEMAPGPCVALVVRDTGTGMSPQVMSRIFEPFFTTKEVGKGTGLGLSTVFGIVKQCGWGIEVDSALGEGSAFTLWIPAQSGAVAAAQAPSRQVPEAAVHSGRVLLVEDDALLREHASDVLESAGYEVVAARDPEEAFERVKDLSGQVDLLLSDIVMPGMTGLELARRMRGSYPLLRVLLMSGYPDTALESRGAQQAEYPVLSKPFSNETLVARVGELLG